MVTARAHSNTPGARFGHTRTLAFFPLPALVPEPCAGVLVSRPSRDASTANPAGHRPEQDYSQHGPTRREQQRELFTDASSWEPRHSA